MPLRLEPPKKGRTSFYRIRGEYLGTKVDKTSGARTKEEANAFKRAIEDDLFGRLKRGELVEKPKGPDFLTGLIAYLESGGDPRFTEKLKEYFLETPLSEIDQRCVDKAARVLYPNASPATRNRQCYTPVSAILRRAGIRAEFKRPKGGNGKRRTFFLQEWEAFALLDAADKIDPKFGALLTFLLYTGCRLSEGLRLEGRDLNFDARKAEIRKSKNGLPRTVRLHIDVVDTLVRITIPKGRIFPWSKESFADSKELYGLWSAACRASGVNIPEKVAFHVLCHSWGAWMTAAGATTSDLIATGRWASRQAASIYEHVQVTTAHRLVDNMPRRLKRANGV